MLNKLKAFLNPDKVSAPVAQGVVAGVMEIAYIILIAIFMVATESLFATPKPWVMIFGIVSFLCLFVLSVAVSGVLVFVWPSYYFMEKKYKEALYAFLATAVTIFVIFTIIFLVSALTSFI